MEDSSLSTSNGRNLFYGLHSLPSMLTLYYCLLCVFTFFIIYFMHTRGDKERNTPNTVFESFPSLLIDVAALWHRIKQLVAGVNLQSGNPTFGDPKQLESVKLSDLHPASWYIVLDIIYICLGFFQLYTSPFCFCFSANRIAPSSGSVLPGILSVRYLQLQGAAKLPSWHTTPWASWSHRLALQIWLMDSLL